MTELTQEHLKELTIYDPELGTFIWSKNINFRYQLIGTSIGCIDKNHGYSFLNVQIDNKKYSVHRLAVLYMTGKYPRPDEYVISLDGNKFNLKWNNLIIVPRKVFLKRHFDLEKYMKERNSKPQQVIPKKTTIIDSFMNFFRV